MNYNNSTIIIINNYNIINVKYMTYIYATYNDSQCLDRTTKWNAVGYDY